MIGKAAHPRRQQHKSNQKHTLQSRNIPARQLRRLHHHRNHGEQDRIIGKRRQELGEQ